MNKFMEFLEKELPKGFYTEENDNEILIRNGGEYIYLFYKQEIEEDFELCCSLVHTIIDLTKLDEK